MKEILIAVLSCMASIATASVCKPNSKNQFIFSVDYFTPGMMGEFQVEGCNGTSPVLEIRRGETYTFIQHDVTNWMHPLGFAYYPDGHHNEHFGVAPEFGHPKPRRENCDLEKFLCDPGHGVKQAPLYGIDEVFETFADWNNNVTSGLNVYEDRFKRPPKQWKHNKYSVKLTIPLDSKTREFFYICLIHAGMSGLVKITDPAENANILMQKFDPENYYKKSNKFDQICGTSEVSSFHNEKEKFCPGQNFLCETQHNKQFSDCMEAISCQMNYEMRVKEDSNPMVVFMHQMIPHHVNAVNMARIALKYGADEVGYDPDFLREIINKQNHQIQKMKIWLKKYEDKKTVPQYCKPPHLTHSLPQSLTWLGWF